MLLSKYEDLSEEPNTHEKSCVATLRAESLVVWRMETGVLLGPTSPNDSQSFNEKSCLKGIRWGESVGQSVSGFCSCVKAHKYKCRHTCHTQIDHMHTNIHTN